MTQFHLRFLGVYALLADGVAVVALMDGAGRKRLTMEVPESGSPSLTFLAEDGSVVKRWTPED